MRIAGRLALAAILVPGAYFAAAGHARVQDSEVLLPEESAAKAKQLLQQGIDALGGSAYLNVRDVTTNQRISEFDHGGEVVGYLDANDFRSLPDKARIEYVAKGHNTILPYLLGVGIEGPEITHGGIVIALYNGDHGWSYDRSGVNDLPASSVSEFQEQVRESIGNILRNRIHEPGMVFRYGGKDIVNLNEVDWVEMVDSEDRTIRIAFARSTHLPVEKTIEIQDPNTRLQTQEIEDYSNYQLIQGIQTPFQITRWHNKIKVYQAFVTSYQYNTNLDASLFTRQSLEDRPGHGDSKHK